MNPSTAAELALDLIRRGFSPVPVPYREKGPVILNWQNLDITEANVGEYFNEQKTNYGVKLGRYGLTDGDLDCAQAVITGKYLLPDTNMVFGRRSKRASHWIYWADPELRSEKFTDPIPDQNGKKITICELRCLKADGTIGLQTVFPGSVHKDTGEPIAYEPGKDGHPANVEANVLLAAIRKVAAAALLARHWPSAGSGRHNCMLALAGVLARARWAEEDALQFCRATYSAITSPSPDGQRRIEHEVRDTFAKISTDQRATGIPTLKEHIRPEVVRTSLDWLEIGAACDEIDLLPFLHNDVGNAQRFIALRGSDFRYCYPFRCWFSWDGRRWARDGGGVARLAAQEAQIEFLRQASKTGDESPAARFARQSLDSRRLSAMLVEAEPHLVITPDELDTDPNLLAFLNGVVDLRTGELRPHRREDFISKLVPFNFTPSASCPLFRCFLDRIMGATPDLSEAELEHVDRRVSYLQTCFGYSMTGLTSDKAVFLAYGGGNNGKTTLLSLFLRLLPEHSALLQIDSLMIRQESNNSQADLADLCGARFVMTSETEEGQRLSEGKLKRITQGMGKIKTARKYENHIEFPETHKLWLDCNHRPVVRGRDKAIWNRLHLIPFQATIQPEEMDKSLPDKLYAEAEGILAWAIAGAVQWYRNGLNRPPDVSQASEQWREEMDQVGRFLADSCIRGKSASVQARQLYKAYRQWAEEAGERYLPEKAFGTRVTDAGFQKDHKETGTVYSGIGLLWQPEPVSG